MKELSFKDIIGDHIYDMEVYGDFSIYGNIDGWFKDVARWETNYMADADILVWVGTGRFWDRWVSPFVKEALDANNGRDDYDFVGVAKKAYKNYLYETLYANYHEVIYEVGLAYLRRHRYKSKQIPEKVDDKLWENVSKGVGEDDLHAYSLTDLFDFIFVDIKTTSLKQAS